jgi:hypothetical protein
MENETNAEILGKKIFFLHPSTLVQNDVIGGLIQQEYEVYATKDHDALRRGLQRFPNSVVFADIDEGMPEKDWESWIQGLKEDPATKNVSVGVISANNNEELKSKYLDSLKVPCGYTVVKAALGNSSIKHIMEILKAVDAKGRRKYMRALVENESNATMNVSMDGDLVNASIKDISVVGFSCIFAKDPGLPKNAVLRDIQIKLQAMLIRVEGIVFGSRMDGPDKVYVLLFSKHTDTEVQTKIRKYVHQNLQSKMDLELK